MPIQLDYMWDRRRLHKSRPRQSYYPVISNLSVTSAGLVTWTTDIPSTSQVLYGPTPNLGLLTAYDSALTTSHSVQLSGLTQTIRYYLKAQSFYIDSLSISRLHSFVYSNGYPALILTSPDATRWAISVTTEGNLSTEATLIGPDGAYEPASVVLVDTDGVYWDLTIQDSGNLETTSGGSPAGALSSLALYDETSATWLLTVSTDGNLITT